MSIPTLYKFQEEGVKFLTTHRNALLADDVGVGKTPQVLVALQRIKAKHALLLCPSAIKYDYLARCVKWGITAENVHIITPRNAGQYAHSSEGIYVINYDIAHRKEVARVFSRKKYDVLICDESHYLKSATALRTKAVFGHGGYASLARYRWLMTGTPVLNRTEELYTAIRALRPDLIAKYSDYISFTRRYSGGHNGPWGWVADGATNVKELAGVLSEFMLRRERDVLPELPDKIVNVVRLERTAALERLLFREPKSDDNSEGAMSIRQQIGIAKVGAIRKYVESILSSEDKVIVFAYHHSVIEDLKSSLSRYRCMAITGTNSAKEKHNIIRQFTLEAEKRVLVLQIDAAGVGIDGLQDVCRHAIFAEASYVPGINQQAMGRIHRNGQTKKTIFDFLTVEESIDENILQRNVSKSEVIQSVLQDRGIIFSINNKNQNKESAMLKTIARVEIRFEANLDSAAVDEITRQVLKVESVRDVFVNVSYGASNDKKGLPESSPETPAAPAAPTVAKAGKKTKVAANPLVTAPSPAVEAAASAVEGLEAVGEVAYKEQIKRTAALIQNFYVKEPAKINSTLTALSKAIRDAFPQYANALVVSDPNDQAAVLNLINTFLADREIPNA